MLRLGIIFGVSCFQNHHTQTSILIEYEKYDIVAKKYSY